MKRKGDKRHKPVINANNYNISPLTDIRANCVLGIYVPQHPSAAMHIQHNAISAIGSRRLGREHSYNNIGAFGFDALDGDILCFADWKDRASTGDQNARCAGRCDGLEMDLLLVDDVFVVERRIFWVDARGNGGMEGVGRLGYAGHFVFLSWCSRYVENNYELGIKKIWETTSYLSRD